jgi:chromosome segregation protein
MRFTRLRLSGFKSFVEPTELRIEAGLTGVVGPNGCGKSNLLEALRWAMGENSYKSMRGAGMDDVIFSGTAARPSRNMAEVVVTLANDDRTAPSQHNEADTLEIVRRIEREAGSAYRINGRDVRARDVQLLFADASTGARSPALVRQGQIGEIIAAKPQARRLILEEAAGITGLHTRRHEAELKLKAAEQNLGRIEDMAAQLETQLNSLRRQARQAQKYKQISAEIRKLEATGLYVAWKEAADAAGRDEKALDAATRQLAEHTRLASQKLRQRDELSDRLPGLREQETIRAAVVQRLSLERTAVDEEERRAAERRGELDQRLTQFDGDLARERELLGDTERMLATLAEEETSLAAAQNDDGAARTEAAQALHAAADALAGSQERADAANARYAELAARRTGVLRAVADEAARIARFEREQQDIEARSTALKAGLGGEEGEALGAAVAAAVQGAAAAESAAAEAEAQVRAARQVEGDTRAAHEEMRRRADRLQTEIRTLMKLLSAEGGKLWPALVEGVKVAEGCEAALAAAIGDDLDASADETAPAHWRLLPPLVDAPPLPEGCEPLGRHVAAPAALNRRLSQVGVVARSAGGALQPALQPGQRLVSREGDLWRWDGFAAAAEAPSAAARRLAERNRLSALEIELAAASRSADESRLAFEASRAAVETAVRSERERRDALRAALGALESARRALAQHERQAAERLAQTGALDEALRRIGQSLAEARSRHAAAEVESQSLPVLDAMQAELERLRDAVHRDRAAHAEARARHDGFEREAERRAARTRTIAGERRQWNERAGRAATHIESLSQRAAETRAAVDELAALPAQLADRRRKLMNAAAEAEAQRRAAADALAAADNDMRAAERALREAQERLATTREDHARLEARLESSRQRHAHCERRIAETLNTTPDRLVEAAAIDPAKIPRHDEIERRLIVLRDDRERLGGVNLRAEEEANEVAGQLDALVRERDDLAQAVAKLRGGIASLNREGRQRLLDAFGTVNRKFGELFTTLFGGGKAELQLVESEDPLEAGLEILAHPPGKKPTVLSLLSGGEQTLTALSLIFAVFLTNPSPICVLDEVDAPLDDHNVERFCNLLDAMLERTETRFLIITHHALTMARMHRLYGVTMMERGVSQLVSVDLEEAERLKEAG